MRCSIGLLRAALCAHGVCYECRTDEDFRADAMGAMDWDGECPHGYTSKTYPSSGLGDVVAKLTKAVGIKPCKGCQKRRTKLNEKFPTKRRK